MDKATTLTIQSARMQTYCLMNTTAYTEDGKIGIFLAEGTGALSQLGVDDDEIREILLLRIGESYNGIYSTVVTRLA